MDDEAEVALAGGFSTVVVRRGDTVRRTASPWTPAVHALLGHLRACGFSLAPVPLGIDDRGREVLSFIDGEVAWWPWPAVLRTDDGIRRVARMVRELGHAVASFDEPADVVWHGGPRTDPDHVLRHGDLAPWNTLWRGEELTGLIDWDTAEPAPRGWDTAQAAWYFVPLRPPTGYRAAEETFTLDDTAHRFAVWCEESEVAGEDLLAAVAAVQRFERDRLTRLGGAGVQPYASFLAKGDLAGIDDDRRWLAEHAARLLRSQ